MKKNGKLFNSNFDKDGLDEFGLHWFQYLAFGFTIFFVLLIWLYFRDYTFQIFIKNIFKILNCSGFNCNGIF